MEESSERRISVGACEPELVSPAPGAVLDNGRADGADSTVWDFNWDDCPGATQYHLIVQKSGFSPHIDDVLTTSSYQLVSNFVDFGGLDWKWRVRAFVDGAWREFSEWRPFVMEPINTDPPAGDVASPTVRPQPTVNVRTPVPVESAEPGTRAPLPPVTPTPTARADVADSVRDLLVHGDGAEAPFFDQNNPAWGEEVYDHAGAAGFADCGRTIAQCGCTMTSLATVLALFGVDTMPDGQELNPRALNQWMTGGSAGGGASDGYTLDGLVIWQTANALSAQAAERRGTPRVRAIPFGSGSEAEVRRELEAGRPVVLWLEGHFVTAVGIEDGEVLIHDPFAEAERAGKVTYDHYAGRVKNSILFEATNDLGAVVISVRAGHRVQVTDSQGRVTGTLDDGDPDDVAEDAREEIPGSSYVYQEDWRDPTCEEPPPDEGSGVNMVTILSPEEETFEVEVVNPDGGETTVAFHVYDEAGNLTVETLEAAGDQKVEVGYDPAEGATQEIEQIEVKDDGDGDSVGGDEDEGGEGDGASPTDASDSELEDYLESMETLHKDLETRLGNIPENDRPAFLKWVTDWSAELQGINPARDARETHGALLDVMSEIVAFENEEWPTRFADCLRVLDSECLDALQAESDMLFERYARGCAELQRLGVARGIVTAPCGIFGETDAGTPTPTSTPRAGGMSSQCADLDGDGYREPVGWNGEGQNWCGTLLEGNFPYKWYENGQCEWGGNPPDDECQR